MDMYIQEFWEEFNQYIRENPDNIDWGEQIPFVPWNKGIKTDRRIVAKSAAARTGRKASKEHRQHISEALTGKKKTVEHCATLSRVRKGHKWSTDKHKQAVSEANRIRWINHRKERTLPCVPTLPQEQPI